MIAVTHKGWNSFKISATYTFSVISTYIVRYPMFDIAFVDDSEINMSLSCLIYFSRFAHFSNTSNSFVNVINVIYAKLIHQFHISRKRLDWGPISGSAELVIQRRLWIHIPVSEFRDGGSVNSDTLSLFWISALSETIRHTTRYVHELFLMFAKDLSVQIKFLSVQIL